MNEESDEDPGELGLAGLEMLLKREETILMHSAGLVEQPTQDNRSKVAGYDISPERLREKIVPEAHSSLGVDHVDVLFLQTPEIMLKFGSNKKQVYEAIRKAFIELETQVSLGKIGSYGITSNSIVAHENKTSDSTLSLQTLLEIASQVNPQHKFSAIQIPANIFQNSVEDVFAVVDLAKVLFFFFFFFLKKKTKQKKIENKNG